MSCNASARVYYVKARFKKWVFKSRQKDAVFVQAWVDVGRLFIPYSWTGTTKRSFSKNSLQPRHSVHFTASGPKSWSGSGSHSQLYTIAEVVRTLPPVDVVHQLQ